MSSPKGKFRVWGKKLYTRISEELGRIFKRIKSNKHVERLSQWLEHLAAENSVLLPILVAATALVIVAIASLYFWIDHFWTFFENVMVEAHGMVFDLIVISSFVFWLQKRGEHRQRIQRYQEELADYIPWQEPEALWRIVGLIKRLNDEKVEDINLQGAYLPGAKLLGAKLTGANLRFAEFTGADLSLTTLVRASLWKANLERVRLETVDLTGADLTDAKLPEANLWNVNLMGANLAGADLTGARLEDADLTKIKHKGFNLPLEWTGGKSTSAKQTKFIKADFKKANLKGADLTDTDLTGAKNLTVNTILLPHK